MCMGVLPECMSVCDVSAWGLQRLEGNRPVERKLQMLLAAV